MQLILWDIRTWVTEHPERYGDTIVANATSGTGSYTEERNCFFVQFDGASCDCLWFGDLVEHRVFKNFTKWDTDLSPEPTDWQARWEYARKVGFSNGSVCGPRTLLDPGDYWFGKQAERGAELLIDFESLYEQRTASDTDRNGSARFLRMACHKPMRMVGLKPAKSNCISNTSLYSKLRTSPLDTGPEQEYTCSMKLLNAPGKVYLLHPA